MKTSKRLLFAVLSFVLCLFTLSAPALTAYASAAGAVGSWQTNTNSLSQVLQDSVAVSYNGYLYVIGGQTSVGTPVNTVYSAAINANGSVGSLTASSNTLPIDLTDATGVVANGYVYIMGGYNGSNPVSSVYYAPLNANGSVGSWTTSSSTLPQNVSGATSVVNNGYIYFMSGSYYTAVFYSKIGSAGSIGSWATNSTTIPLALDSPSSFVFDNNVYIVGGYNGSSASDTIYYAPINSNATIGSWTTNTSTLGTAVYGADVAQYNGYVFVAGGFGDSGVTNNVYSAPMHTNGSVGSFTASSNSLPSLEAFMATTLYNGYTYAIGGTGSSAVYYASLTGYPTPTLASNIQNSVVSGSSVTVNVTNGVSGNPDPNSVTIVSGPYHGTAVDPAGSITYTPNNGYTGTDSLVYQVCSLNDESLCAQASLTFDITADPTASASTPDTGYGTPSSTNSLTTVLIASAIVSTGLGLALLYRSKRITTTKQ